jgi:hypothetical protein
MEKNIESWKDLMGNNLIVAESKEDVPDIISGIITNNFGEIKWYGNGKLVKETI